MGLSMQSFADADFASKAADRRSVSGGVVMCCGGPVARMSSTQTCVTTSTTVEDYVALGDVVKQASFLRHARRFFLQEASMPLIPVLEDNEGAISLASNPTTNSNSNGIDVRHYVPRARVERDKIKVIYVPSAYQPADFLTKALTREAFEIHREIVMILWSEG